jgi:hypothetical protein
VIGVVNSPAVEDVVTCGNGFDRVFADGKDLVAPDCERVADTGPERSRLDVPQSFWERLPPPF